MLILSLFYTRPVALIVCRGNYEYQCHFFSIANLTCSWTLAYGLVDAGCFVLSASPSGPKIIVIFVFVFKYLRTFIRVWLSDDDDPDDGVSVCHDAGHVNTGGEWQWQRPRSGPRTSQWMTSVLITVRSDSTQPCRLCTRIRSPGPGVREIICLLIGHKAPEAASDWPISCQDRLQCSLSLGHWTLSPDQTITNIFPLDPTFVWLSF